MGEHIKLDKVLITGGAGFIGTKIAFQLKEKGYEVMILDNLSPLIHGPDFNKTGTYRELCAEYSVVEGSILDQDVLHDCIIKNDAIIHLAAETGTGKSMYDIFHYTNVNANGTALLWDILGNKDHQIRKVVLASSRAVYGEGKYYCKEHGAVYPNSRLEKDLKNKDFHTKCPSCQRNVALLPTDEDAKLHPVSIYGITKQVQEQLAMISGEAMGIPTTSLRFQNVYGPGQSLKNPYTGILSIFSSRLLNGNDINIFEDGLESRDFVYIDDVVNATIASLESNSANGQIYNVGSGQPIAVLQVAEKLSQALGREFNYTISGNFRVGDIRHNYADISKISKELGFQPLTSFDQGIGRFADWVKEQEVEEDKFAASIMEMRSKGLYH